MDMNSQSENIQVHILEPLKTVPSDAERYASEGAAACDPGQSNEMEIELDRLRANLVRAFAIPSDASILEAGGGYGAITGVLAARGRHVTVWDTSAKRCRIIARKNAGRENLSLYSGDFYAFCEEIRADRDRSGSGFDFITCIGPMQNADRICQGASSCAEIFRLLLSLLNQTGSMLILLQDIREYRALTSWIRHFGLKESVYYVSPDADYPLEISSERWLSERHSQDSYSGIKNGREAVLLLLTRTQESRAGLLYAKFSNERAAEYALYTSVCQENFSDSMQQKVKLTDSAQTERYVEKTALTEEGQAHVQRIFTLYGKLSEMYNGRLLINRCEQTDNRCSVRFAYLQGETYETYLDRILLEQGPDACEKALSDYMEMVVPKQLEVPFTETDEYTEIFGDLPDAWKNGSLRTLPISDLDLIPANVIRSENGNTLIDYEWTFEFPVPSDFLRYRILFYYLRGRDIRKGLDQERIYKKIGIDVKKREYFASMEDSFQRWITRDMVPVRDLLKESNAATQESNPEPVRNLRVYFSNSGDAAFSEDNSEEYPMEDGRISMEITLPGTVKYVRLDPGDYPGILRINQLCIDGKPPVLIRTNGVPVLQDIKTNEIKIGQISSGHAQNILDVFFSIEDPYVVICRSDRTQANRYSDYTLMLDLCFQEERPDYLQPLADYQKQRQTRDTGIMRSLCSFRLRMKNRKEHAFK